MSYEIVYSITAHEHIESVYGLYENIVKFNGELNCLVVVHCEDELYNLRDSIPARKNLFFNPIRTKKERFSSSIFFAHFDNYNLVRQYDFNFFCTLSSNNLFVRPINFEQIKTETPFLNVNKTGYSLGDKDMWMCDEFIKNRALAHLFYDYEIAVNVAPHPGTYYRKEVISFMDKFCKDIGINKEIFVNDVFGAEEVMFPSLEKYATGYVSKRYAVCLYGQTLHDIKDVIKNGTCRKLVGNHYIMVRVDRDPQDELRKFITKKIW